jgi:lysophospholipase L1-like esterase
MISAARGWLARAKLAPNPCKTSTHEWPPSRFHRVYRFRHGCARPRSAMRTAFRWKRRTGIMVEAPPNARALVTFGVSITDGATSTPDANHRWPDVLARRLVQADGAPVAVLNQGISGARVLSDRMGVNAWARFDRDVLSLPHADTVILMLGINDIGWPGTAQASSFGRRHHRRL